MMEGPLAGPSSGGLQGSNIPATRCASVQVLGLMAAAVLEYLGIVCWGFGPRPSTCARLNQMFLLVDQRRSHDLDGV